MLLFLTTNMAGVTSRVNQQLQYPQHRSLLTHAFDWTYHFSHVKKTSFTILIVSCFSRVKNIPSLFG